MLLLERNVLVLVCKVGANLSSERIGIRKQAPSDFQEQLAKRSVNQVFKDH